MTEAVEEGAVCMPNIGRKGQQRRMVMGSVALVVGAGLLGWMVSTGQAQLMRLGLVPVFFYGALCVLQARAKT